MKTFGYLRVSTDKQDEENQRGEILRYMPVDEFIAIECSSRKSQQARGITDLLARVSYGDTIVVTELSRLARSTSELLLMVDGFIKAGVGLTVLKQSIKIPANGDKMDASTKTLVTMFGLMAELERDFISMRTKMGLAARKAAGVRLGKPPGTLGISGLDPHRDEISVMIARGDSVLSIAKAVGFGRTTVKSYIKSRGLKIFPFSKNI
jgi:DNA invertase Pin-like site-specific DNA recombinase